MPDYLNPNSKAVYLLDESGRSVVKIPAFGRTTLPEYFDRYIAPGKVRRAPLGLGRDSKSVHKISRSQRVVPKTPQSTKRPAAKPPSKPTVRRGTPVTRVIRGPAKNVVGRKADNPKVAYANAIGTNQYSISNGVGVGILSYNRPESLRRLLDSILDHTDLSATTVFVSDDGSNNKEINEILNTYDKLGIVCIKNNARVGVAGNTNRLLRCLARFDHCFLLNDDVEILSDGWETFYVNAAKKSKLKHFCMRQAGIYGADAGVPVIRNGVQLRKVEEKPHGAVLYFESACLRKVGYFNEAFGIYGMEHVDWSTRVYLNEMQEPGYFDVAGSNTYFLMHPDISAVDDRTSHLKAARALYSPSPKYVCATDKSNVQSVSYIIPVRITNDRVDSILTSLNNIRAQKFPAIEIIVVEHDGDKKARFSDAIRYHFIEDVGAFNKSRAFNHGALCASHKVLIFHDADLLVDDGYTSKQFALLKANDASHIGQKVLYLSPKSTSDVNTTARIDNTLACDKTVGYFEGGSTALTKNAFLQIGGYDEDFIGYGNEDTEFFSRMSTLRLYNTRSEQFLHLWHGRAAGWEEAHIINKALEATKRKVPMSTRIASLRKKISP